VPFSSHRLVAVLAVAFAGLAIAAAVGVLVGSGASPPGEVLAALVGRGDAVLIDIVWQVRVPVVAMAAAVGALLGISGAGAQGVLRNPLADPWILGVSGGAGLAVGFVVALGADTTFGAVTLPFVAFAGALGAIGLLRLVAAALPGGGTTAGGATSLLLAGVVLNAFASAAVLVLHALLAPEASHRLLLWLMGTLQPARLDPTLVAVTSVTGLVGMVLLLRVSHGLNLLGFGDEAASAFGVDVARTRRLGVAGIALTVSAAVALSGLVGFVGLVVPHLVRLVVGADQRYVVPLSLVGGGAFVVLADAVARSLFSVAETAIPVGAVTALVGAPLFVALLIRGATEAST